MATPKPSLLSALLRPNLWTDYLIGMVMVALTVDIEDTYRMFVTEMKLAVDRVEALGLGDIPTANAIQARVDRSQAHVLVPRDGAQAGNAHMDRGGHVDGRRHASGGSLRQLKTKTRF
ncbi:hypothetical protein AURDEDRAFT_132151 [Auricularia subglabra TFB-10046 SS5]|uniref:Uncharacterized protein n=1 Tax=Auricularia subglabra (strain TFB-10046 / SS5) TaxID=717982 RepID=J0CQB1_AURST|nr:hypothetical protein AURDEDRAFT_132151 [Auricularia subglabra TFB-10046 SS5]